jgi:hypothetical protein
MADVTFKWQDATLTTSVKRVVRGVRESHTQQQQQQQPRWLERSTITLAVDRRITIACGAHWAHIQLPQAPAAGFSCTPSLGFRLSPRLVGIVKMVVVTTTTMRCIHDPSALAADVAQQDDVRLAATTTEGGKRSWRYCRPPPPPPPRQLASSLAVAKV